MALLKKFQYPNGTETNYHKLGEIRIVPIADKVTYIEVPVEEPDAPVESIDPVVIDAGEATDPEIVNPEVEPEGGPEIEYIPVYTKQFSIMIQILSYVSQEIRETGVNNHLSSRLDYFVVTIDELIATDIMKLGYHLVKTLPEFVDAEDI